MMSLKRSACPLTWSVLAGMAMLGVPSTAPAAVFTIDWLEMSSVSFGSPVPSGSNCWLPGVGNVTLTHTMPGSWSQSRAWGSPYQNGSITDTNSNTYSWGVHEHLDVLNTTGSVPPVSTAWSVTYTFPGTQTAGTIIVSVGGLGRTNDFGGIASLATVNQSGEYLNDFASGQGFGANQFSGGTGSFTLMNSTTGNGTQNPHWNTEFALVRIDDAVSSLTIHFDQYPGDGIAMNIGVIPAPGAIALLGIAGAVCARRQRPSPSAKN